MHLPSLVQGKGERNQEGFLKTPCDLIHTTSGRERTISQQQQQKNPLKDAYTASIIHILLYQANPNNRCESDRQTERQRNPDGRTEDKPMGGESAGESVTFRRPLITSATSTLIKPSLQGSEVIFPSQSSLSIKFLLNKVIEYPYQYVASFDQGYRISNCFS